MNTFIIAVRIDSGERLSNLDFCIKFLKHNFDYSIILIEEDVISRIEGRYQGVKHVFIKSYFPLFHRTRLINKAVNELVITEFICLLDMDIFIDPEIYEQAIEYLKEYSVVYPFDGRFYDIPQRYKSAALKMSDVAEGDKAMLNAYSVGGAIFFRTSDFIKGGMENEFFLGWGFEDNERFIRFRKLGFRIKRMDNPMFHFIHSRGINSSGRNPNVRQNKAEFDKVERMSVLELHDYVDTAFHWCKYRKIMKISIVIPVYEMAGLGLEFLRYNLGHILEQTFTDYEVIISDHSVNDDIKQLVESYKEDRFIYIKNIEKRGNSSANVNCAVLHTSGEIIKPIFQDDYLYSSRALEAIHLKFVNGAKWVAVGSNQTSNRVIHSTPMIPKWNDNIIYGVNTISSPSCVAYLKDYEIVWDERLIWLMDCKFYYEMYCKYGLPEIVEETLVSNFVHPDQLGNTISEAVKKYEVELMKSEYASK